MAAPNLFGGAEERNLGLVHLSLGEMSIFVARMVKMEERIWNKRFFRYFCHPKQKNGPFV